MPKIDTLVDDIYELLDKGTTQPSQENLFAMASNIMDSVRKQLWSATSDRKRTLRMSNIGKPCSRSLWYDMNGDENEEGFSPQTRIKFLMGDIVEAVILFLAKEAGHDVTDQQKKITIDDIDGHIDAVIDGELVDVKSTSSYGMRKFRDGTLPNDDPFGYISQISGYANALGKSSGTFLAFDKSGGDLATYTHDDLEDTSEKISEIKKAIAMKEPPARAFAPVTERSTNKAKLGINCSYCSHKTTCWEDPGLDLKFKSGRPVFYVKEEADA
jgi:hypothetical protein